MQTMTTHTDRGVAESVTVEHVDDPLALYCHYQGQSGPQSCFVRFDLRDGRLWAGHNPEIGPGTPFPVLHGLIREWRIPALKADAANRLLDSLVPACQALLDNPDTRVYWDGSNWRGEADDDDIRYGVFYRDWYDEQRVQVRDAGDWYGTIGSEGAIREALGITADTTDEEIREIVASEDVDILEGGEEYLQRLRDEAEEEAEEEAAK